MSQIAFLRASALCNACHDVRVPGAGSLTQEEHDINPGGDKVAYFRLENLSTEWQTGPYNSNDNPFGKVVRCQDCHMSSFPGICVQDAPNSVGAGGEGCPKGTHFSPRAHTESAKWAEMLLLPAPECPVKNVSAPLSMSNDTPASASRPFG